MLKGKNYKNVDMVFPFLSAVIHRCNGWMGKAPLTKVHMLYSELNLSGMRDNS